MKLKLYYLILLFPIIGVAQQDVFPQIQYEKNNLTTPTVFGENIISTKENSEFDLTFSKDGKRIYFTRREPEQKQKIFFSDFKNGNWSKPKIADFSTDRDETPFITPNGKYFFFGSEREIPGKPNKGNFDMNIWMMENQNGIWSR